MLLLRQAQEAMRQQQLEQELSETEDVIFHLVQAEQSSSLQRTSVLIKTMHFIHLHMRTEHIT